MEFCNVCGETKLADWNARVKALCLRCQSLERHRQLRWSLERLGYLKAEAQHGKRVLHMAPERCTHDYLSQVFGAGYVCSDMVPENYPYAQCLKLVLPVGFEIFPAGYFQLIVHNHVLEHIPGDFRDHVNAMVNLLAGGGI